MGAGGAPRPLQVRLPCGLQAPGRCGWTRALLLCRLVLLPRPVRERTPDRSLGADLSLGRLGRLPPVPAPGHQTAPCSADDLGHRATAGPLPLPGFAPRDSSPNCSVFTCLCPGVFYLNLWPCGMQRHLISWGGGIVFTLPRMPGLEYKQFAPHPPSNPSAAPRTSWPGAHGCPGRGSSCRRARGRLGPQLVATDGAC